MSANSSRRTNDEWRRHRGAVVEKTALDGSLIRGSRGGYNDDQGEKCEGGGLELHVARVFVVRLRNGQGCTTLNSGVRWKGTSRGREVYPEISSLLYYLMISTAWSVHARQRNRDIVLGNHPNDVEPSPR